MTYQNDLTYEEDAIIIDGINEQYLKNKDTKKNQLIISLSNLEYTFIYSRYSNLDDNQKNIPKSNNFKLNFLIDSENNRINFNSLEFESLHFSFKELLKITNELISIHKLFQERSFEFIHIQNASDYLTQQILANTSLNYEQFNVFADKSLEYYTDFQKNINKDKYPEIQRFIKYLTTLDYFSAFKEYLQLNKRISIPPSLSKKFISIIVNVYNKDLLKMGLETLFNNSIFDLEIICINNSYEDIRDIIDKFRDKFYNIKVIYSENGIYSFNRQMAEANGSYTLFTNLSNLISVNYIDNLNKMIHDSAKKRYDITLFNFKNSIKDEYDKILETLSERAFHPHSRSEKELYVLYQANCDKLINTKFYIKENDSKLKNLSIEPLTYMDLLINANKIYLSYILLKDDERLEKIPLAYESLNTESKIRNKIKSLRNNTPLEPKVDEIIKYSEKTIEDKYPKISIIIPAYNPKKKDIQMLMISLFNQTFDFNYLEVIFIDDQSTNKEGIDLIKEYVLEYPNIKLYQTTVNSGSGIARNIGLDNAQGKFIMFLDHDDYYFANACEILYNTITEEDDIQMVHGNNIRPNWDYDRLDWNKLGITSYKNITTTIDEKYKFINLGSAVWHMIFRKEFLDKKNIRFKDYRISQDTLFHDTCLLQDSKTVFINEAIVFYEQREIRNSEGSKTLENNLENLLTRFKTRYEISRIYDNYAPEYKNIILNDVNYISEFLLKTCLNYEEFKEYVDVSSQFYADYLDNIHTKQYPKISKLCEAIANKEYILAYREYSKQFNEDNPNYF